MLKSLLADFFPSDYRCDPRYLEVSKLDGIYDVETTADKLILDHAKMRYAEIVQTRHRLEDRLGELLRTAGLITTIMGAAVTGFHVSFNWWLRGSFFFLLLAIIVSIIGTRSFRRASPSRVDELIKAVQAPGGVEAPDAWLALALHDTIEATLCQEEWLANSVNMASWLIAIGVGLLFPAMLLI